MKHTYPNNYCILKRALDILKTFSRQFVLLLSVIMLALSVPTSDTFAQTDKKGNFLQRRFKRKNKFQRKSSRNKDDFQRKPYDCAKIGKTKVEKLRISKKQLQKWEEERMVKEQQAQRKAKAAQAESVILSASTTNEDLVEVASTSPKTVELESEPTQTQSSNLEVQVQESSASIVEENVQTQETEPMLGWYETDKPQAPTVTPIRINTKGELEKDTKESFETTAKYGRLGYFIHLKSANQQTLNTLKIKFVQAGVAETHIKTSVEQQQNDLVQVDIEAK